MTLKHPDLLRPVAVLSGRGRKDCYEMDGWCNLLGSAEPSPLSLGMKRDV